NQNGPKLTQVLPEGRVTVLDISEALCVLFGNIAARDISAFGSFPLTQDNSQISVPGMRWFHNAYSHLVSYGGRREAYADVRQTRAKATSVPARPSGSTKPRKSGRCECSDIADYGVHHGIVSAKGWIDHPEPPSGSSAARVLCSDHRSWLQFGSHLKRRFRCRRYSAE